MHPQLILILYVASAMILYGLAITGIINLYFEGKIITVAVTTILLLISICFTSYMLGVLMR